MSQSSRRSRGVSTLLALALCLCGASGCGGSRTPTSATPPPTTTTPPVVTTPPPATVVTVVTVSSSGVSPAVLTVPIGTRVTFTNADNRFHDFSGGPDPAHPECPQIDEAGFIVAGQSKQTGAFGEARTCQYHDHAYLGVAAFTGRIVIQ